MSGGVKAPGSEAVALASSGCRKGPDRWRIFQALKEGGDARKQGTAPSAMRPARDIMIRVLMASAILAVASLVAGSADAQQKAVPASWTRPARKSARRSWSNATAACRSRRPSRAPPGEHGTSTFTRPESAIPRSSRPVGTRIRPVGSTARTLAGPHSGDLPNLMVPSSGTVKFDPNSQRPLARRRPGYLLDADGAALVVHEKAGDYKWILPNSEGVWPAA